MHNIKNKTNNGFKCRIKQSVNQDLGIYARDAIKLLRNLWQEFGVRNATQKDET